MPDAAPNGEAPQTDLRHVGPYTLQRELGRGGMGAVFLAKRDTDGLLVALKVLDYVGGEDPETVTRFKREARFMLSLDHQNLVRAFEVGNHEGRHYMAMEYVMGESLHALIKRKGKLEPIEALKIMSDVVAALQYGSRYDVVHRDVKPHNILLSEAGGVKLADMGLAILANRKDLRLTAPGMSIGTPHYMSPEQARADRDIDSRSDIYSLGCTFYHAICGQTPITGSNAIKIAHNHLSQVPQPPRELVGGLDTDIEQLLLKCIEKSPGDRFQNFQQLMQSLRMILASAKPNPSQTPVTIRLPKSATRVARFQPSDDDSVSTDKKGVQIPLMPKTNPMAASGMPPPPVAVPQGSARAIAEPPTPRPQGRPEPATAPVPPSRPGRAAPPARPGTGTGLMLIGSIVIVGAVGAIAAVVWLLW